jgi:cysteine desulfurase
MWDILNGKRWRSAKRVYLDTAGAMPVRPEAREAFLEASKLEGNPGALHAEAGRAQAVLSHARASIAEALGVKAREIILTSGGTEGNNLAILGLFKKLALGGRTIGTMHWIVSAIEHPSVLECFAHIEQMGGKVTRIMPDSTGRILAARVRDALTDETVMVSIGWANGEIGTVQPVSTVAETLRSYEKAHGTRIIFHTDAGQAPIYLFPYAHTLGVDLMTLDGGKLGSPRGIGALYVASGVALASLLYGGGQESGLRPGTENVALAAGLAAALSSLARMRAAESLRMAGLRERLLLGIAQSRVLRGAVVNGSPKHHLPHIVNVSIPLIENEYITLALDQAGFALATKSACKEGERASHVISAITDAPNAWRATTALRISMGSATSVEDVERFLHALERVIMRFRAQAQVEAA